MIKNNNEINYVLSGSTLEVNVKNENHLYSILSSEFNNLFKKYEGITEIKFNDKLILYLDEYLICPSGVNIIFGKSLELLSWIHESNCKIYNLNITSNTLKFHSKIQFINCEINSKKLVINK
nr:MAG TPA: hypothetical protein [Caudoviricetes sp.]